MTFFPIFRFIFRVFRFCGSVPSIIHSILFQVVDVVTDSNKENKDKEENEGETDQSESSSTTTTTILTSASVFKEKRTHRDLIDSIRRKVAPNTQSKSIKGNSLPANYQSVTAKGYLDYEQLSLIYPQQLNKPCAVTEVLTTTTKGLHLNISDAMVNRNASLPNMRAISPFSISPIMFDRFMTDQKRFNTNQMNMNGGQNPSERRQTLQKAKAVSEEFKEPFRGRLYCMDPKGSTIDRRTRSVSSPANICNQLNSFDGVKKAATA